MHEYMEIEVELTEVEPHIWRRFLLPSSVPLVKLHEAIEDVFDWGNWRPGFFYTYGDESALIAGDYWGDEEPGRRESVPSMWEFPMSKCIGPEAESCVGYTYGLYLQWKHRVTLRDVVSLQQKFEQKLVAGGRAIPVRETFDVAEYLRCVEYVNTGRPEGVLPKHLRVPKDWHPDVFDLKKEQRGFDVTESPKVVIERRMAQARREEEFYRSLEARPLESFDAFLIRVALARGARKEWYSMLACPSCRSNGRFESVYVWIDPDSSRAAFRCPACEADGIAKDLAGQPIALPEVEDTTQLEDPVSVVLSKRDFLELDSCEMPFGDAKALVFSAERVGPNVKISAEYDRMDTLLMFAADHAADLAHKGGERYERLRRVAEVIQDEM